jgi:hypothetical protein
MKIVLNRRTCTCWDSPCEAHFGAHFLGPEITPIDCLVEMSDDGRQELTFLILDRDGVDRQLVVDETNRALAHDSWRLAWEAQQSGDQ